MFKYLLSIFYISMIIMVFIRLNGALVKKTCNHLVNNNYCKNLGN